MKTRAFATAIMCCALPVFADDVLEFRLAEKSPTDGWTKADYKGEILWLSPKPDLTSVHVGSAAFQWSGPSLSPEAIADLKKRMPEATIDTNRQPQVSVKFTEEGKKEFADVTGRNVRKRLAILSGGRILTAPVIMEQIPGGAVVIQGGLTETEARHLADRLNGNKSNQVPEDTARKLADPQH